MRQLLLSAHPDSNGKIRLESGEYRYLVNVLRKAVGDAIEVRLSDGSLSMMRISAIDLKEKQISLVVSEREESSRNSCEMPHQIELPHQIADFPHIILFQWILKGPKMDQVIRQATETGIAHIIPVAGERCLSRDAGCVGDEKTGRWERIVREARQQSGSPFATRIFQPVPVSGIAEIWKSLSTGKNPVALVLTEAPLARKSLHEYLVNGASSSALAIGPEGGMTAGEMELLADAGFFCVHFRTNILRAETAALYGIAALQSALTELENWQLKELIL